MPEYREVQLRDGKLWLNIARGEVAGQQKWAETAVHSSGGGGYVSRQGGFVAPPRISSTTREKHEFWICEDEGKETAINLTDGNFPVREGQKVWVAWGNSCSRKTNGRYLFAHNYASGNSCDLIKAWGPWLYGAGLLKTPLLYRVLTSWLPLLLGLLISFVWLPLFFSPDALAVLPVDAKPEQILLKVINPLFIVQHWPSAVVASLGKNIGTMIFIFGATWIGNLLFLKFFGNLLFLQWWERKQVPAIRAKIFHACQSQI